MRVMPLRPARRIILRSLKRSMPSRAWTACATGIDPQKVWRAIESNLGVTASELAGPSRKERIAAARRVAIILLWDAGWTLQSIGDLLGGRDHSTIIYGRNKAQAEMESNRHYSAFVAEMRRELYRQETAQ